MYKGYCTVKYPRKYGHQNTVCCDAPYCDWISPPNEWGNIWLTDFAVRIELTTYKYMNKYTFEFEVNLFYGFCRRFYGEWNVRNSVARYFTLKFSANILQWWWYKNSSTASLLNLITSKMAIPEPWLFLYFCLISLSLLEKNRHKTTCLHCNL